jgi:hypothetical protein
MGHIGYSVRWRRSFLDALQLLGGAAARLPLGTPDPVITGATAVELYTGGLWVAAELEIFSGNMAALRDELVAQGFRWAAEPPRGGPGLWHPTLRMGATIAHDRVLVAAARANILSLVVDSHDDVTARSAAACVSVLGIEDVIANQILLWLGEGARPGESLTLIDVLVSLARAGVSGPFRPSYLERRLAQETRGAVTLGSMNTTSALDDVSRRVVPLSAMEAIVHRWRGSHGLGAEQVVDQRAPTAVTGSTMGIRNDLADRGESSSLQLANVIPFRPIRYARPPGGEGS